MLQVEHLRKTFGRVVAVDDVSFEIQPGTILGIVGQNGSGKTTIFRMILNFLTPENGGQVKWDGQPLHMKKVYDTVLKAQLACCEQAKAGMRGCDVDKIARDIINEAGYQGCFGHGLGHAVGIEIHENPRYSPTCESVVKAGMMMTIEPGIYLEGKFGVRIEDTIIVRDGGCEILGKSDKNLIIL